MNIKSNTKPFSKSPLSTECFCDVERGTGGESKTALRLESVRRLRTIIDPEVGINIVDLGLLYQVYEKDQKLVVHITVTTPGCPIRRYIEQQVKSVLSGLAEIELHVVLEPRWSPEMVACNVNLFNI